jgi:hypothetical protein
MFSISHAPRSAVCSDEKHGGCVVISGMRPVFPAVDKQSLIRETKTARPRTARLIISKRMKGL